VTDLFTNRQLAVLGSALNWVSTSDLDPKVRSGLRLAVSNALATNNKLCSYAHDYGRLSALFSVRGYSLPALPVELNPLHSHSGRGTLRNCIERVARAGAGTVRRHTWDVGGGGPIPLVMELPRGSSTTHVTCRSATAAARTRDPVADLCVFDPPYFDYIAYTELSEFYRAWLTNAKPSGQSLLPAGPEAGESFGLDLGIAIRSALARLAPGRPLAFTYHSTNPEAWRAIAVALDEAKLRVTALWPVRSDGHMGHHSHPGNCEWDLVLVCRRVTETTPSMARLSVDEWCHSASPLTVGDADRVSMELAISVVIERFGSVSGGAS
jgi:putative DNA methylase